MFCRGKVTYCTSCFTFPLSAYRKSGTTGTARHLSSTEHARALLAVDLVLPLGLGRLVRFRRLARLGAVLGAKRARLFLRGRGGTEG